MNILTGGITLVLIVAVVVLILFLIVFVTKYKTVGPDEALIVSGSYLGRKNVKAEKKSKLFVVAVHS